MKRLTTTSRLFKGERVTAFLDKVERKMGRKGMDTDTKRHDFILSYCGTMVKTDYENHLEMKARKILRKEQKGRTKEQRRKEKVMEGEEEEGEEEGVEDEEEEEVLYKKIEDLKTTKELKNFLRNQYEDLDDPVTEQDLESLSKKAKREGYTLLAYTSEFATKVAKMDPNARPQDSTIGNTFLKGLSKKHVKDIGDIIIQKGRRDTKWESMYEAATLVAKKEREIVKAVGRWVYSKDEDGSGSSEEEEEGEMEDEEVKSESSGSDSDDEDSHARRKVKVRRKQVRKKEGKEVKESMKQEDEKKKEVKSSEDERKEKIVDELTKEFEMMNLFTQQGGREEDWLPRYANSIDAFRTGLKQSKSKAMKEDESQKGKNLPVVGEATTPAKVYRCRGCDRTSPECFGVWRCARIDEAIAKGWPLRKEVTTTPEGKTFTRIIDTTTGLEFPNMAGRGGILGYLQEKIEKKKEGKGLNSRMYQAVDMWMAQCEQELERWSESGEGSDCESEGSGVEVETSKGGAIPLYEPMVDRQGNLVLLVGTEKYPVEEYLSKIAKEEVTVSDANAAEARLIKKTGVSDDTLFKCDDVVYEVLAGKRSREKEDETSPELVEDLTKRLRSGKDFNSNAKIVPAPLRELDEGGSRMKKAKEVEERNRKGEGEKTKNFDSGKGKEKSKEDVGQGEKGKGEANKENEGAGKGRYKYGQVGPVAEINSDEVIKRVLSETKVEMSVLELMAVSRDASKAVYDWTRLHRVPIENPQSSNFRTWFTSEQEDVLIDRLLTEDEPPNTVCNWLKSNYHEKLTKEEQEVFEGQGGYQRSAKKGKEFGGKRNKVTVKGAKVKVRSFQTMVERERTVDRDIQYSTMSSPCLLNVGFQGCVSINKVPIDTGSEITLTTPELALKAKHLNAVEERITLFMHDVNGGQARMGGLIRNGELCPAGDLKVKQKIWITPANAESSYTMILGMPFLFATAAALRYDTGGNIWMTMTTPDSKQQVSVMVGGIDDQRNVVEFPTDHSKGRRGFRERLL